MKKTPSIVTGSVLALLGVLLVIVASFSFLITMILPESYKSTARISVERVVLEKSGQPSPPVPYDPYFIQTEFERIQSTAVLNQVITNLNLNMTWAAKFKAEGELSSEVTCGLLKRQLDVRQSRNTSLIEIRVASEDKMEAAVVANEIAKVYRDVRNGGASGVLVEIIDLGHPAWRPNKPGRAIVVILFLAGVLVFVAGLALLIAAFIRRKSSPLPSPLARTS